MIVPTNFWLLTRCSNSLTARSGAASGSTAKPENRFGYFDMASASTSLASRASAMASAASSCSAPGWVSERTCTSMPAASIWAIRPSPMSDKSLTSRSALASPRDCSLRSRAGPSRKPGVTKCSSSVIVRMAVSSAILSAGKLRAVATDPLQCARYRRNAEPISDGWRSDRTTRCSRRIWRIGQSDRALTGRPGLGARSPRDLVAGGRLHGFLDPLLDSFQVEACALLHWRKLERSLGELTNLLLHKLESPELVDKPVIVSQRPLVSAGQARAFERIEPDVGEDWPIHLDRAAEPATWLIRETILEVVGTHPA